MEKNEKKPQELNQLVANVEAKPAEREEDRQAYNHDLPVIFAYSRAQAIEDGFLVDVSEMAKEAGFRYPVAFTNAVYVRYVEVPEGVEGQDESGRLWDILFMCRHAIRRSKGGSICFFYLLVRNDNKGARRVMLKAICGANDDFSPCITVMMPDED